MRLEEHRIFSHLVETLSTLEINFEPPVKQKKQTPETDQKNYVPSLQKTKSMSQV